MHSLANQVKASPHTSRCDWLAKPDMVDYASNLSEVLRTTTNYVFAFILQLFKDNEGVNRYIGLYNTIFVSHLSQFSSVCLTLVRSMGASL